MTGVSCVLCALVCQHATVTCSASKRRLCWLDDRSLVVGEEAVDRKALGRVMSSLGAMYQHLGQPDKAIGLLEKASAIANDVGDPKFQGASCADLAIGYQAMGLYEKAITLGEQNVVIYYYSRTSANS